MRRSKIFKIAAVIILGLMVFFWLVTSVIGMLAGVSGELNNLIIMLVVILLALYFFLLPTDLQTITPQLILICVPLTLAGLLFIEADWASKKRI
jgi:hypothetical protein